MKLEFGDKLQPQRLEFGLLRWKNLSTWNSSFLDLSFIKPNAEEPDMKKNRGRRRSAELKKNRGRRYGWRRTDTRWTIWFQIYSSKEEQRKTIYLEKNKHWGNKMVELKF